MTCLSERLIARYSFGHIAFTRDFAPLVTDWMIARACEAGLDNAIPPGNGYVSEVAIKPHCIRTKHIRRPHCSDAPFRASYRKVLIPEHGFYTRFRATCHGKDDCQGLSSRFGQCKTPGEWLTLGSGHQTALYTYAAHKAAAPQ